MSLWRNSGGRLRSMKLAVRGERWRSNSNANASIRSPQDLVHEHGPRRVHDACVPGRIRQIPWRCLLGWQRHPERVHSGGPNHVHAVDRAHLGRRAGHGQIGRSAPRAPARRLRAQPHGRERQQSHNADDTSSASLHFSSLRHFVCILEPKKKFPAGPGEATENLSFTFTAAGILKYA